MLAVNSSLSVNIDNKSPEFHSTLMRRKLITYYHHLLHIEKVSLHDILINLTHFTTRWTNL